MRIVFLNYLIINIYLSNISLNLVNKDVYLCYILFNKIFGGHMTRQQYIMNDETMYIVAKPNGRYVESSIAELYGDPILCLKSPNKIIEYNCKYHSQNYVSRKDLTKGLTDIRAKHPIIVDLFASYIYFCTHSDRVMENSWFNLKYIKRYYEYRGMTKVIFENNEELKVNISYSSFNNQYLNAVRLYYKFTLEKEKYYKKSHNQTITYEQFQTDESHEVNYINEAARAAYKKYMRGIDELNSLI